MVWYFYLLKNFLQFVVIYTVKGSGMVNKVEVDVFLELKKVLMTKPVIKDVDLFK